tara:strand:+ start:192 stop:1034 length:843 start_codon:yes stop_codon:yes gene_type:complete
MPTTTFDPSTNEVSVEQKTAEAAALEKGQELADANAEDKLRQFEKTESENELIGGKFRTQEDLLKAYQELQTKLGSNEKTEEGEEATAEADEAPTDETSEEEEPVDETVNYMLELNKEFQEKGELTEDAIDKLSSMDSKDLIASYMKYQAVASEEARAGMQNQAAIDAIKNSVGGDEAYGEMIGWAAQNLSQDEINDYNSITNSGNPTAIKFAVESLANRYQSSEGYEAPLVTGRKASSNVKAYRSQAELARDIANPLYSTDPAFRQDVEDRLARSTDLL